MYFGSTKKKKIFCEKKIFFGGHFEKNDQKLRVRARVMITSSPCVRSLSRSKHWFKTKIPPDVFLFLLKK